MISLDVENGKIRCVEGTGRRGAAAISGYFEVEFPAGLSLLDEGAPQKLGAILSEKLVRRVARDRKCTVSIRSADLFFRRITLPKANPAQIKEMVSHSLNGILMAKDYYVDYTVEREFIENDKKQLEVLLCGATKNLSKAYYSMIIAANLIPYRMDAQQNNIHRLIAGNTDINGQKINDKAILLIDAGRELVGSDLIAGGKSVFERTTYAKTQLDPLDFNGGYGEFDILSAGAEPQNINPVYARISDEARKMLQFSFTKTVKIPVSRIYLYGECSEDVLLSEYLTESLGVQTEPVRDITGIKLQNNYSGPGICKICGLAAALL